MANPAAAVPLENPVILDLSSQLGYSLVGAVLSSVIWGISCMQTFIYFVNFPDDSSVLRSLMGILWALDTCSVALVWSALWRPLISHWGSLATLGGNMPDLYHHNWVGAVLTGGVQFVFIWRLWRLARYRLKWIIPAVLVIMNLYQIGACIAFSVIGLGAPTLAIIGTYKMKVLRISIRATTVVSDILICGGLLQVLLANGLPKFLGSRKIVSRLIVVTINSGLWTAILACVSMIMMLWHTNGVEYAVVDEPLRSLYFASLLSNLNARTFVRGRQQDYAEFFASTHDDGTRSHDASRFDTRSRGGDTIVFKQITRHTDSQMGGGAQHGEFIQKRPYPNDTMPVDHKGGYPV